MKEGVSVSAGGECECMGVCFCDSTCGTGLYVCLTSTGHMWPEVCGNVRV